jgi:hypothetical protein
MSGGKPIPTRKGGMGGCHELNFPFENADYAEAAKQGLAPIPADKYPYLNRLTHQGIDGNYNGIHDFEFGLELVLNGLESFQNVGSEHVKMELK